MVRVTLIKDIFSNTKETFDIDSGITVNNIIEDNFTSKSCTQIEVYNQQTGETRFVEESENDFEYDVIVNDKKVTDFNIPLNDGDNVVILTVPKGGGNPVEWIQDTIEDITDNFWSGMNNGWDAFGWGAIGGALGFGLFGLTGLGIGILAGITISGYQENKNEVEVSTSTSTSKSGKDITDIPDASGARNSSILDKKYPLLLGKHLITPYVCGSPYNETNGTKGKNTYIHLMLCAGYSPLKLTDFKLGDLYLAHNKSNTVSGHLNERETVMHGKLTGYVDNNYDSGDILRRWKLNDVSIEIMQKGGDSSDNSDAYPSVYPQAVIQSSPDATVLFVCDGTIGDVATYKGCSFDSGYRTNSVRFSDSCPSAMEVEISAPNGLYKSRTRTTKDGNNSTTVYEYSKLPIYLAIQWRYYKDSNASSSGDNGSGWTSFSSLNGVSPVTLTRAMIASSTSAHTGNSLPDNYHDYTDNWIGCQVFNLQDFSGEESDGSLSQMRFVARYDFSSAECLKISGLYSVGSTLNADLNSVEVRVIRVDSSYLDETTTTRYSGDGYSYGAYSFNDVTKWSYLRTFKYDEDAFKKAVVYDSSGNITSYPSSMDSYKLRPYNLEDSKKFCFIALKIKADLTGEVNGQLDKINCIAESFAPTYNSATGSWSIPSVVSEYKYYDSSLNEITQEQYEAGIESGEDVTKKKTGNDYNSQLRALLWNSSCYSTANSRYFLPSSYDSLYISNNIASVYLAAMIGTHLGREAKPYSEINMQSVAEAYSFYEDVTDGSTYSESDSEYVVGGTNIRHMRWTFNGYITEATKLETLVQNILNTGRACQTIDDKCRYQIIIDKKRNYPVMLINQQNCISLSNMRSFEDNISGYKVTFQNEDDGYDSSTLYAMMDGEDYKNPTNDVTATSFKYVTNPVQVWSLARYNLARLLVEKEYLERTVGLAGISLQLGDMVNVQDDTILVGTGTGARVQQLIADDAYIYGFVTDELYDYTGEVNTSGKCKLGVKILQPSKWNASRIVTLRMAATSGVTMADGTLLAPVVGKTNNVIFERPIIKSSQKLADSDDADVCLYLPEVDNIVAFGEVENIISQYIVAKITPQEGFKYKLLLYPYDDSIYSYGTALPTIQANMTKPNRTGDDNIKLSTGVTQEQLESQIVSAVDNATAAVNGTTQTTAIINLVCMAYKDGVKLSWDRSSIITGSTTYYIRISKDGGVTWSGSVTYGTDNYITAISGFGSTAEDYYYQFDRATDGYPEISDLSTWQFNVVAKDTSKYFSTEVTASVDTSSYGTWKLQEPSVSTSVTDRTVILSISQPSRSDGKEVYGTVKNMIRIKRAQNSYTNSSGILVIVPADTQWFCPSTSSNPYTDENNYKNKSATTAYLLGVSSSYVQVMPLYGQGSDGTGTNLINTSYYFDIQSYNEANNSGWLSSSSNEITATATITSLRDFVIANETAKESVVESLSALSANVGQISDGRFGDDILNYWALSTMNMSDTTEDKVNTIGAFRVGGTSEFLKIIPQNVTAGVPSSYKIIFKVGNFEVTSTASNINGELTIQSSDSSLDRTKITPNGTFYQHRETVSSDWETIASTNVNGLMTKQLFSENTLFITNEDMAQRRSEGYDIGIPYLSSNSKVYHFDTDIYDQNQTNDLTITDASSGGHSLVGADTENNDIDFTPAILAVAPYSTIGKSLYGQYKISSSFSSCSIFTVDFWIQYIYAENQIIFNIGNTEDKVSLIIASGECFFEKGIDDVSGIPFNAEITQSRLYNKISEKDCFFNSDDVLTFNKHDTDECRFESPAPINKEFNSTYKYYTMSVVGGTETFAQTLITVSTYYDALISGLYEKTIAFNNPDEAHSYLKHAGQTQYETKELADLGVSFNSNEWLHMGIVFNDSTINIFLNNAVCRCSRYGTAADNLAVDLNSGMNSFLLDEMMIDTTVSELESDFITHTTNRIPWAALDKSNDYMVLTAKDLNNFKTNIFDSQIFVDKVTAIVNSLSTSV